MNRAYLQIYLYTIIFSFLASLSAKIGIIYSLSKENVSSNAILRFISGLATGLILGIVFLFLCPHSDNTIQSNYSWLLIGIVIFLAIDGYLSNPLGFSKGKDERMPSRGIKIFFCQIIINMSCGAALAVGFKMRLMKGIFLAFGIILYQFPRSIINLNKLKNNWSFRSSIIGAFLSPFTIPIGTVIALFLLNASIVPASLIGAVYGITIGLLIYIGISDIIRRTDTCPSSIAFGIGVVTALLIRTLSL